MLRDSQSIIVIEQPCIVWFVEPLNNGHERMKQFGVIYVNVVWGIAIWR